MLSGDVCVARTYWEDSRSPTTWDKAFSHGHHEVKCVRDLENRRDERLRSLQADSGGRGGYEVSHKEHLWTEGYPGIRGRGWVEFRSSSLLSSGAVGGCCAHRPDACGHNASQRVKRAINYFSS